MIKYRRLSLEELSELETEFVRFLAAQSIAAEDWVKIKAEDQDRETELIDEFSNVVIEKTLFNIKYLEQRTDRRILCYKVLEDQILLTGIELESNTQFDFTTAFQLSELVTMFEDPAINISFLSGNKPTEDIKQEIYGLLEEDAMISETSDLYDFINTLKGHFSEEEE